MNLLEKWQKWLSENPPPLYIGELQIAEGYWIYNRKDQLNDSLLCLTSLLDLKLYLRQDERGHYRPLKAEMGILRGWKYGPVDFKGLFYAIEAIYSFALTHWFGLKARIIGPVSFQKTIGRQIGMYKVIEKEADFLADRTVEALCRVKCLRQNLWHGSYSEPKEEASIPLVCLEACPLFLEHSRKLFFKKTTTLSK